jgi:hypothetical protein
VRVLAAWGRRLALAIGVVAFAVRPTSAVVLAYVGLRALWFSPSFSERLRLVFCEVLPIGYPVSLSIDLSTSPPITTSTSQPSLP